MQQLRATNVTRGTLLGDRIRTAARWWRRFIGLLGTRSLEDGEGLLLTPCKAVHTYGMRYTIDVAFLDAEMRVVARYGWLAPGRRSKFHREAMYALELPAGELDRTGTQQGDQLTISADPEQPGSARPSSASQSAS